MTAPRMTSSMLCESMCWVYIARMFSGRIYPHESIATDSTVMQKMVFMPKFHPTMNPATARSNTLIMNTNVPIDNAGNTWLSSIDKPVAPPPIPPAGMMQATQPNA